MPKPHARTPGRLIATVAYRESDIEGDEGFLNIALHHSGNISILKPGEQLPLDLIPSEASPPVLYGGRVDVVTLVAHNRPIPQD